MTLGVNGIERKRRLTRTGKPRKHDELVSRNRDVDIFEVMLSCAFNDDIFLWHSFAFQRRSASFLLFIGLEFFNFITQKSGVLEFKHLRRLPHFGGKLSYRLFTVKT